MASQRRRGSVLQRSPGNWSVIVNLGRDPETSKWRQHWETIKGNKRQAEQRLTQLLREQDVGGFVKPGNGTLGEYLQDWLETVVKLRNRARTINGYETIVRRHLTPQLGRIQLSKLTPSHLERLYAGLLGQGLSKNTVRHVHICLSKALNDALLKGLVGRNICKVVQCPSPGRYEVQIPELEGLWHILDLARETNYHVLLHLVAHTGLRRAEVLALSWQDVDFEQGLVSMTRTLQRIGKEGLRIEPTKSSSGRRGIALDPGTVDLLREHRGQQLLYKMQLGERWNEMDLLFPGPFGKPLDPATLTRNFEKSARKAGYPGLRLHDLRHIHAAGLIRSGAHPKVVQERLGHANPAFTMAVYGHVSPGMQSEAANAFANLLAGSVH